MKSFIIGLLLGTALTYSVSFIIDLNNRMDVLERQNLLLKTRVLDIEKDCGTLAEFLLKYFTEADEAVLKRI